MWRNWAGDQRCTPAAIERPGSVEEVAAAVGRAAAAGQTVRVAGSGHSFGDIALTTGRLLSLERMDRVLDLDAAAGRVRVQGGITIHALSTALAERGLALENLGDIDVQSIAGATQTGTHGTGARLRNISSQIEELELVTGTGERVRCSRDADPDAWRAARVGVGSLGVVTELTLRCVPAFTLEGIDEPRPLDETLDALDEHAAANDHFELYVFPHTRTALTRTNNRVDRAPEPSGRARAWLEDVALTNGGFGALCALGRRMPSRIPQINRLCTRLAGRRVRVDASHRIFSSPRMVRFTEMEYAIPREHAAAAVRRVLALPAERGFDVSFPIELRFVAQDDAFLSPAGGRDTAYVAVHMYRGMVWEPYFRAVEEHMDSIGGRPHWGKRHFQSAETLAPRYPEWDRFQAVRARLDPEGRFANAWAERTLGPISVPAEA